MYTWGKNESYSYFTSITNIHSGWMADPNVKSKSIKLLKENIEYLHDLIAVNNFFPSFSPPINCTTTHIIAHVTFDLCIFLLPYTWSFTIPSSTSKMRIIPTHIFIFLPLIMHKPSSSDCKSLLTVLFAFTSYFTFLIKLVH